jgi:pyrimidine operon attenuation protein/uracil phosphoribosyltransferase
MSTEPKLPDAEALLAKLTTELRKVVNDETALVGIHTGGLWLAERLHSALEVKHPLGALDISFYRDDFGAIGLHPQVKPSDIPFGVDGRQIILVDDVLYTGRTIRAAMNELFDYGRPAAIVLAALIDRGGRELPIAAQFVGATLKVPANQVLVLERGSDNLLCLALQERKT